MEFITADVEIKGQLSDATVAALLPTTMGEGELIVLEYPVLPFVRTGWQTVKGDLRLLLSCGHVIVGSAPQEAAEMLVLKGFPVRCKECLR